MSESKEIEDCPSEEASSQSESYDANKKGPAEAYDVKDFCPGIRIEAKDFDGKWYPAKVSDVDWTENEILVHFENWNTKFDEWIPMDSSRLRPIQKQSYQQKDIVKFVKGEEVMAMWSPYQKYPATIQAVLANDRYDVLFYDGFLKRLKSHKISKLEGPVIKTEVKNFTDIGTKEERRERKRKINVAELFHINKRSKKKGLVHSKSQDIKTYPVTKSKSKNSLFKKVVTQRENKEKILGSETNEVKKPEVPTHTPTFPTKALIDTIPAAFEVKYINGQSEMWSKQLYQRSEGRTAGKLDIVILNPQGRKFRSRNEIMKYCEENGIIYSHEAFDFSAKGRPKSKPNVQPPQPKLESSSTDDKEKSLKKGQRKSNFGEVTSTPPSQATTNQELLPADTSATENKVFIGEFEVAIENGKFICPVKSCAKHFRRENLLHMHVKHYHPEFSKYLDYTPSVTDLAYARTVGGLDVSEVTSPAPRKVAGAEKTEKSNVKGDNQRKSGGDFGAENSKDSKKPKLDIRPESKSLSTKIPADTLTPAAVQSEDSFEGGQKSKSTSGNLSTTKNVSSFNERDGYVQENKGYFLENRPVEQVGSETENQMSSHPVVKSSVRHPHRLHSRKKASRFQGSFVEHMKKKKLIQHDGARSQNKLGRHQQQSHLRQRLQPGKTPLTPISSQSFVEDSNSNTSSQVQSLTRYPKPHLNLPNEISGKNNLLTSSKTFSPVSNRIDETSALDNVENIRGNSSLPKIDSNTDKFVEGGKTVGADSQKLLEVKQINRRSYIAGLLNARKRKERFAGFSLRKKRKSRIRNTIRTMNSGWNVKNNESGLGQGLKEPDEVPNANSIPTMPDVMVNDSAKQDDTVHVSSFIMKESSDSDRCEETYHVRKKKHKKSKCRMSLKLKIKRVDINNLQIAQGNVQNENNNFNKTEQSVELNNKELDSVGNESDSKDEIVEVEDISEVKFCKTENSEQSGQNFTYKIPDHISNLDEKKRHDSFGKNAEMKEVKRLLKHEKDLQYEVNCRNLVSSYVLLENICRNELNDKYLSRSPKGNDENSKVLAAAQRNGKKRKRKNACGRGRDGTHSSRKKVRFENTVTEKWISFDESEEFGGILGKSGRSKTDPKGRDGRRGAERTKKLTKSQSDYEKEVNQVKRPDDTSRHENPIPHNSSGLEESKASLVVENDKIEKLRRNEIINCVCGIVEEDGLMIQCDICLCWQHGHCAGILRELDVPDKYICAICKNPYRGRESMKYLHDQEWLKEGTLPSLTFRSKREDIVNQRKTILKRSHDLSGSIALLARLIHSLRVKVNIAEKKDHPKLWLWAKKWTEKKPNRLKEETEVKEEKIEETPVDSNSIVKKEETLTEDDKQIPKAPEPEAPIDSAECRLNLLDHLIHYQTLIDARLSCIESLVAELESMQDDAVNDETPDRYPRTKATVQMLLRDLNTMKKIALI